MITEKTCYKCGKVNLIIYLYREKNYCHECFRPIMEIIRDEEQKHPRPLDDNEFIFFPRMDEDARSAAINWIVANSFISIQRQEYAYAFIKCGFIHPDLTNAFRKAQGNPPLTHGEIRFTKQELHEWCVAISEYLNWHREHE